MSATEISQIALNWSNAVGQIALALVALHSIKRRKKRHSHKVSHRASPTQLDAKGLK